MTEEDREPEVIPELAALAKKVSIQNRRGALEVELRAAQKIVGQVRRKITLLQRECEHPIYSRMMVKVVDSEGDLVHAVQCSDCEGFL